MLVPAGNGNDACRYIKSREGLSGYETGGPYTLVHLRLTTGRTDLREFLWKHWLEHKRGVAEANVGTTIQLAQTGPLELSSDAARHCHLSATFRNPYKTVSPFSVHRV